MRIAFRNGMVLSPYARLSWVHEFNPDRAINASFIALPAAAFTVDGPRAASDARPRASREYRRDAFDPKRS
jgi:uncharacterized protein with beta-barrel porin domain